MPLLTRSTILLILLFGATISTHAQSTQSESKEATGSISGRVTIGGKPVSGIIVSLQPADTYSQRPPAVKATTDEEGRYRLAGVAAGRYTVTAPATAFILPSERPGQPGKTVTIAEGENVEGIDLTLTLGGVITGRVTHAGGWPVIGAGVELNIIRPDGRKQPLPPLNEMYETDDRGVYRIYGLPAGRYLVGVRSRPAGDRLTRARTFHPGVTEEAQATIVEVTEGGEATDVDIKLGHTTQTYEVSGRFVNGETGQPIPIRGQAGTSGGKELTQYHFGPGNDPSGKFHLKGLSPGHYAISFRGDGESQSEFHSEPVFFDVTDGDITGLEIKLYRGASISGVAIIEGANDSALLAALSQLQIAAFLQRKDGLYINGMQIRIGADGRFRIPGLPPSRVTFMPTPSPGRTRGFSLLRVERDGVEQRGGIEVVEGEQVTGVRLILAYGTGIVRGRVQIVGGTLPDGIRPYVSLRFVTAAPSQPTIPLPGAEVDARGQFLLEGLAPGNYELTLGFTFSSIVSRPLPRPPRFPTIKQIVTVSNGVESQVTLTLDLSAKEKER